jgi:hypothetical protein
MSEEFKEGTPLVPERPKRAWRPSLLLRISGVSAAFVMEALGTLLLTVTVVMVTSTGPGGEGARCSTRRSCEASHVPFLL